MVQPSAVVAKLKLSMGHHDLRFLVAILSAVLGLIASKAVPVNLSLLRWIVGIGFGIGGFIAGIVLLSKIFRNRIIFKRIYRTK